MNNNRLLALVALVALAACADVGTPRVVAERDDRITLAWFEGSDLDADAWMIARAHCGDTGRVPLVAARSDKGRAIKRSYVCAEPPSEAGPGVTWTADGADPVSAGL
jgi:hypothetical protein